MNIRKSYIWTADKDVNTKAIFTVITVYPHFICSSNIWLSYIQSRLFTTPRVYFEPTQWPAPSWFVGSVGRALHRRGHRFKSRTVQAWFFFRSSFHYCLRSVYNCEDRFPIHVFTAVQIYDFHIITANFHFVHHLLNLSTTFLFVCILW